MWSYAFFSSRKSVFSYNKKYLFCFSSWWLTWDKKIHVYGAVTTISERSLFLYSPFGPSVYTDSHILRKCTCAHTGTHSSVKSWATARLPLADKGWRGIPECFIKSPFHVFAAGKDVREHHESWCPSSTGDIVLSVLHSLKEKGAGRTLSIDSSGQQCWEMGRRWAEVW